MLAERKRAYVSKNISNTSAYIRCAHLGTSTLALRARLSPNQFLRPTPYPLDHGDSSERYPRLALFSSLRLLCFVEHGTTKSVRQSVSQSVTVELQLFNI